MDSIKNYVTRHLQAGLNSLGQISRSPIASLMTCLVIGITLALPTLLFVALHNAENIRDRFQQTTQITLYLKKNVSASQVNTLTRHLAKQSGIETATAISPEQGIKELQQQAGFQGVLEELQDNPLPWAITLTLTTTILDKHQNVDALTHALSQLPEVDNIQLDMLWVKRLSTLIALAKSMTIALGLFLGIAVLLIVNNSIRSATQHNQHEIDIIKLIGGTNAFIRRPFLYAGIGQNAINQAKQFHDAIGISGIALTKLDGTAKGGIIFAIAKQMQVPLRFIGIGESIDDLRPFNADDFVAALFEGTL